MDLVGRLKLFLNQNGIANSQFADTCGIPRPSLSQLLNGRNKKVSDELISKVHAAYPQLNIMWLMFGDGAMYIDGTSQAQGELNFHDSQLAENSKFENSPVETRKNGKEISFGEFDLFDAATDKKVAESNLSEVMGQVATKGNIAARKPIGAVTHSRKVVSIMVFYDDNSFENFIPR